MFDLVSSRRTLSRWALAATLLFSACSSGSSSSSAPVRADFSGTWTVDVTITQAGACGDYQDNDTFQVTAVFSQSSDGVVTDDDNDPQSRLSGTVSGLSVTLTNQKGSTITLTMPNATATTMSGSGTIVENCANQISVTGTKSNAPANADFSGTWDIELTITQAGACGDYQDNEVVQTSAVFTQTSDGVVTDDDNDPQTQLSGTVHGLSVTLTNQAGSSVTLTLPSANATTLSGSGTLVENCANQFTVTGTKQTGGGGGSCDTLQTGTWTLRVFHDGNETFVFENGTLTQNACSVTFAWSDNSTNPPTSANWTGTMTGAAWNPTGSGDFPISISGSFSSATSYSGTTDLGIGGTDTVTLTHQ